VGWPLIFPDLTAAALALVCSFVPLARAGLPGASTLSDRRALSVDSFRIKSDPEPDQSTVKLVYENRGEKRGIARLDLNDRIAEAVEKEWLTRRRLHLSADVLGLAAVRLFIPLACATS
jgi:hypothetical protein